MLYKVSSLYNSPVVWRVGKTMISRCDIVRSSVKKKHGVIFTQSGHAVYAGFRSRWRSASFSFMSFLLFIDNADC